jgi:predicted RNase H-like nuclease
MLDGCYLGVDLAWGQKNRTGLALLDGAGTLVASTSVRTDDEIASFVEVHGRKTLVAAIDAPLVVPNDTGQRPCEAEVGRHFGRYGAGAYPANRGNPSFFPEPRGARLATRLGWTMDPAELPAAGRSVCIEVYPHPAMVSLFSLGYVIPYKQKPGRDVAARRASFAVLIAAMERHVGKLLQLDQSGRWRELCGVAHAASRHSELNVIEDEIDAILCAYLAWLWTHEHDSLMVHGDGILGYIVTPSPPTTEPTPPRSSVQGRDSDRSVKDVGDHAAGPLQSDRLAEAFGAAVPRLSPQECASLADVAREQLS